ncbi:MAG: hypothetical protein ACTSUE_09845 [Promethearchaeota archaeon]
MKIGQDRPREPITQGNLLNAVQEQRDMIDKMYYNSVRAVNIAGVIAGLFILMVFASIIACICWWIWHIQVYDLANENKQEIKDLSDDVSGVVTNLTGTNHSILSGLDNDDHLHYALVTGRPTTEFTTHAADATIHFIESTIDLASLGTGVAVTPGNRDVKSLVEGSGVTIISTGTEITISANVTGIEGDIELISIGTGENITAGGIELKSVQGGDGINVECINNNTLQINSTVALVSVGTGEALPAGDLDVKSLVSGNGSVVFSSTSTEVDLSLNMAYVEGELDLFLTNLGSGTFLSPNGDNFDVRSLTSSTIDITNSSTEVNIDINITTISNQINLNDVSTGESIKGSGGLDVKGIKAGGGGEITIYSTGTDIVIDVDTNELDLNTLGSGLSLAPGGLDIKSLVAGAGIDIVSGANTLTIETDIDVTYAIPTNSTVVLTDNLLTANTGTGVISTTGGSVTLQTVTSDCPGASEVAVGCNCDRNLNSGDPALIMLKAATIFSNATGSEEQCICEWEVAHADGANYTFSAQAVCLLFTT